MSGGEADNINDRIVRYIDFFGDRSSLIFCYHLADMEIDRVEASDAFDEDSVRAFVQHTILNGCLNASLLALRDLDDFFGSRRAHADDLRASDYGVSESSGFLATSERRKINKFVAHITKHGAEVDCGGWDLKELISKALSQSHAFLDVLKANHTFHDNYDAWVSATFYQRQAEEMFKWIDSEAQS
jgi:hypothetical protein